MSQSPRTEVGDISSATAVPATIITSMDIGSRLKVYTIDEQPSECSSRWWFYSMSEDVPIITSGNYADMVNGASVSSGYWRNCYPDAPTIPAYSPAMCTGRWTMATIYTPRTTSPASIASWSAICCPKSMVYMQRCQSIVSTSTSVEVLLPTQTDLPTQSEGNTQRTRSVRYLDAGMAWAEPITVHWQSSDLTRFPTTYASALAAKMGVTITPERSGSELPTLEGVGVPYPSTHELDDAPTSGPSKTTIAGFSVAAFIGIALVAGAVLFCLRRRRRQNQRVFAEQHGVVTELSNQSTGFRSFVRGRWRAEMEAKPVPVEIDSGGNKYTPAGPIAELEAPVHHPDKDPDQFSFTGSDFETRRVDVNEERLANGETTMNEENDADVKKSESKEAA